MPFEITLPGRRGPNAGEIVWVISLGLCQVLRQFLRLPGSWRVSLGAGRLGEGDCRERQHYRKDRQQLHETISHFAISSVIGSPTCFTLRPQFDYWPGSSVSL